MTEGQGPAVPRRRAAAGPCRIGADPGRLLT